MPTKRWTLLFVALLAAAACAQQQMPAADAGPMNIAPQPPRPDQNGVYQVGPGIAPPQIVAAVPAVYPADAQALDHPLACILSAVIDVAGMPTNIELARGCRFQEYLAPSIEAVKQSRFQPGTLDGKPVPVQVHISVVFRSTGAQAVPRLALGFHEGPAGEGGGAPHQRAYDKPPVVLKFAEAEFSDEARRHKIQGIVLLSVLVGADGLPADVHVEKGIGHGLDEKAVEAANQYRFKPAMKDGVPVSTRISMEISFKLY